MTLALVVLLPFLGAVLPPLAEKAGLSRNSIALAAAVLPLVALLGLWQPGLMVLDGATITFSQPWMPSLGLALAFRLDGLSLLFALLVLGIGLLVIIYARYYLSDQDSSGRFFAFLLLFMGAMLGLVTSDNLLLLVLFWELTSLSSFLLISFWSDSSSARKGARMALAVTSMGGFALLAGVLLIGQIVGSFSLGTVLASGELIRSSPWYPLILCLVLLGVFTKSAQFPFHFWLPQAMSAPTPVSAYLHSATMVKAGVFLLARLYPALSGTSLWFELVAGIGMATFLWGAIRALFQHDLKGLLACSTISHLGLITLLFGLDTPLAAVAAVFHIINHATFKASLFMAAGIIEHETGSRDMHRLSGLWKYMPHTAVLAMVASAAMAGVPLLNGFLSKEMFFGVTLQSGLPGGIPNWLLPLGATLGGVFSVAYSARFIHDVFFKGEPIDLPKFPPHEPSRYMRIPVEVLVTLCVAVGMLPAITVGRLLSVASTATLGSLPPDYYLRVWHGFNLPLLMSFVALAGGVLVYANRRYLFAMADHMPSLDANRSFEAGIRILFRFAVMVSKRLRSGSLQSYTAWLLALVVLVLVTALPLPAIEVSSLSPWDAVTLLGAVVLMVASVVTVVWHHQRFTALVMVGVVGLIVSLLFVRFSAPDLALTQLAVEVITVLLMLLALYFLPARGRRQSGPWRIGRDALLAVVTGGGVGVAALAMMTGGFQSISTSISGYFLAQSVPGGGGANVVNVILVDFRGFDTFGEITVLGVAALGIAAMLRGLRLPSSTVDEEGRPWAVDHHPLLLASLSRLLLPLALLVALYLFLRGHNQPGGGFIAGLVIAVALILQYMASGTTWARRRQLTNHRPLISGGLLLAGVTGMGAWLFGFPFLTSAHGHVTIPLIGEVELTSAMLFDAGVLFTVVGATRLILIRLGGLAQPGDHVVGDNMVGNNVVSNNVADHEGAENDSGGPAIWK